MATADGPRDDMAAMMREMQRRIDALERKSSLANTGLTALGPGIVQVDGAIQSANYVAGVSGWRFDGTSLEVNTGVIGNGALANPVIPGVVNVTANTFAVTASWTDAVATTVTVPAGCSRLLASCAGEAFAINPNTTGGSNGAGGDLLDVRVAFNGSQSASYGVPLSGSGGFTSSVSVGSFTFTGLTPGSTLALSTQTLALYQSFAAADPANNKATITATLLWLR